MEAFLLQPDLITHNPPTEYLEGRGEWWAGIAPGLFPDPRGREFGFGAVGYVTEDDEERVYHVPILRERLHEATLTIRVLAFALDGHVTDAMKLKPVGNRFQLLSFRTSAKHDIHGHSVGGVVHPAFRRWLASFAKRTDVTQYLARADEAMLAVYTSIARPEALKFAKDNCYSRISEDGRFFFTCPGNACDIAIYPDNEHGGAHVNYEYGSDFSCHNLDSAGQQVTLLAGLAVLLEIASADLG